MSRKSWGRRPQNWIALTGILIAYGSLAYAQYEEPEPYESPADRFIYGGIQSLHLAPRSSNPVGDSLGIRFTRLMPIIGFRQGLVDINIGYTRYDQHGTMRPAIVLGTTVATEFHITGKASSSLLFPLLLSADLARAEASGLQRDDFNVGSVGIGAGLRYRLRDGGTVFSAGAIAAAEYSFEGFSSSSGSSLLGLGEAVLQLNDVLVAGGIVIGYRVRIQQWSMSRALSDYHLLSHGPFVGVMF